MLLHQPGYEATLALNHEKLHALAGSPCDRIYVATVDDEFVGGISLPILPLFHANGNLGRITSMVADARCRGGGIGGAPMVAAERWFENGGCVRSLLSKKARFVRALFRRTRLE